MPWPLDNEPAEAVVDAELTSTWWTVKTYYKKNCEQHEHYTHPDYEKPIIVQEGFRWAEFRVETTDGNPPEFEFQACPGGSADLDSVDLNSCFGSNVDSTELYSLDDGCWREIVWPEDMPEDEQQRLEELVDNEGAWALEDEEGWCLDETEVWVWGPIEITNDDGYHRIIIADEQGTAVDFKEEE
jgi:hypothetical protein